LLSGEPGDPRHSNDLLAVLLAQAAAPVKAAELAGEEAAVAAFRDARSAGASGAARPGTAVPRWMHRSVQLAAVAVTATAAGGIALAAGTGPRSPDPAPTSPGASASPSRPAGTPSGGRGQVAGRPPAGGAEPSTVGLCRAYRAGAGDAPGRALDNPAFAALIEAAGGRDKVPGYCAAVLTPRPGTGADQGSARPSARPSDRPTRADRPRGRPGPRTTKPNTREAPVTPAIGSATPPTGRVAPTGSATPPAGPATTSPAAPMRSPEGP
jgi:hypothetical protein